MIRVSNMRMKNIKEEDRPLILNATTQWKEKGVELKRLLLSKFKDRSTAEKRLLWLYEMQISSIEREIKEVNKNLKRLSSQLNVANGSALSTPKLDAQTLKENADFSEIIDRYISNYKRLGDKITCKCPFHDDKSPSFSVDVEKKLYYCHGCGEGGDIIKFLMKIEKCDFVQALKLLE